MSNEEFLNNIQSKTNNELLEIFKSFLPLFFRVLKNNNHYCMFVSIFKNYNCDFMALLTKHISLVLRNLSHFQKEMVVFRIEKKYSYWEDEYTKYMVTSYPIFCLILIGCMFNYLGFKTTHGFFYKDYKIIQEEIQKLHGTN